MELVPVPHRTTHAERRRLLLGLLVLGPVVLLVLLPEVLGLDRYVVTDDSMQGHLGRGSVLLAREVPAAALQPGDVVSYRPAGDAATDREVRRVTEVAGGVATVAGDRAGDEGGETAVQSLPLADRTYARVWVAVPWIGYPFVLDGGWLVLSVIAVGALGLAVGLGRRRSSRPQPRADAPVVGARRVPARP